MIGKRLANGRISPINVLERMAPFMGESDDVCWEHLGCANEGGHVRIRLDDKSRTMAHRVAYEAYHAEPIPKGLQVNHHCDNPRCFNPAHLYLGTQAENMNDRFDRGRANLKCKLSVEDVDYILKSSKSDKELAAMFNVTPQAIRYRRKVGQGRGR